MPGRARCLAASLVGLVVLGATACAPKKAVETIEQGRTTSCASDQKVVETAVETFYAAGGAQGSATVAGLVAAQLLREPSISYQIAADGVSVVPIPGGPCDTTGATTTAAPATGTGTGSGTEQCEADRATLQAAVDAFGATYNVSPMSEAELVTAGLLVAQVAGYDLQGSTVVPVPGVCA
jgi:hypothetical protein